MKFYKKTIIEELEGCLPKYLDMTTPIAIKLDDRYLSPPVGMIERKVWNAAIDQMEEALNKL